MDHYFAQKMIRGPAQEPALHALMPASPEDYHSACEPLEFEYECEGSEESDTDSTGYSAMTTAMSYHNTDHSQHRNTKKRDKKCRNQKHCNQQGGHKTNTKKLKNWRSGWAILLLFWELTKEGALMYANWRGEVEEYIMKGYSRRSRMPCLPPW